MTRTRSAIFEQAARDWAEMKAAFHDHREAAFFRAEEATHGFMVNREGRAAGATGEDLFSGPEARARRFASDELLEHWEAFPRPSMVAFEREWLELRQWSSGTA